MRIYTVDPARGRLQGATATVNVAYEPLEPGPVGARFAVVGSNGLSRGTGTDGDGTILPKYGPVDLEDRRVLILSGHEPAPCDPVFHHQMAYAVACNTYAAFRHALGREIEWGFSEPRLQLRIHALDAAQAVYDPDRGEIRFGYFRAGADVRGRVPPLGTVYLCLSHDVVAHEVTHALVDGLRARFGRAYVTHVDVDAFHEAFADLVALLLRFSYREVVHEAVSETNGEFWRHESFLRFGVQAGQGEGMESLRRPDLLKEARRYDPDGEVYALGTVLVSAILEALIVVYRRKTERLLRLASGGTGLFPPGARYPADLVEALGQVASRLASQFLTICIRALDYCPPVGLDFGEYLRALVTADFELVPDDPWGYREALIDSFIRRGIYPRHVQSMSEDALRWHGPNTPRPLREPRLSFASLRFAGDPASPFGPAEVKRRASALGRLVAQPDHLREFGLARLDDPDLNGDRVDPPVVESVRSARRVGPDGQVIFDLVCEVTQCRYVRRSDGSEMPYWGGSTIIIDPDGVVRLIVRKSVTGRDQIERKHRYEARLREEAKPVIVDVDPTAGP